MRVLEIVLGVVCGLISFWYWHLARIAAKEMPKPDVSQVYRGHWGDSEILEQYEKEMEEYDKSL